MQASENLAIGFSADESDFYSFSENTHQVYHGRNLPEKHSACLWGLVQH
jgi:hypothetical protein